MQKSGKKTKERSNQCEWNQWKSLFYADHKSYKRAGNAVLQLSIYTSIPPRAMRYTPPPIFPIHFRTSSSASLLLLFFSFSFSLLCSTTQIDIGAGNMKLNKREGRGEDPEGARWTSNPVVVRQSQDCYTYRRRSTSIGFGISSLTFSLSPSLFFPPSANVVLFLSSSN